MKKFLASISLLAVVGCGDSDGDRGGANATSGGGASSSVSSSSKGGGSTGTGSGGEAEWTLVPWLSNSCVFEYAQKPEYAFPQLEWEACPGSATGCDRIAKNWPHDSPISIAGPAVLRTASGYRFGVYAGYPDFDKRIAFFDEAGVPAAAYRVDPGTVCQATRPGLSEAGHWVGVQQVGNPTPSTYVFQATGRTPASALVAPTTTLSQYQRGAAELLALQLDFGKGLEIFDRTTQSVHVTSPTLLGADVPRLVDDAAFFLAYPEYNKPEAWVWTRASGNYQELIDKNPNHVVDIQSDGTSLVWIETPPKPNNGPWPAGSLYSSAYATTSAGVQGTLRRAMPLVEPGYSSAMGEGYYAVWGTPTSFHVIRLSDAQLWTVDIPMDEWQALLNDVSYVDATYVFYKTDTHVYRQRIDALGTGMPAN